MFWFMVDSKAAMQIHSEKQSEYNTPKDSISMLHRQWQKPSFHLWPFVPSRFRDIYTRVSEYRGSRDHPMVTLETLIY